MRRRIREPGSTAATSARLALLESELADMGRGAQREADRAQVAIAAARTEAEASARSAVAARLELAAATESLEHTRRRNLDLEQEARSLREQHAHLEERLQQTTEALEHSRALAEVMHTTADRLSAELERVPGLRFVGSADHRASVLSFVVDGIHPHDLGTILDQEGVAIRTGHHCAQPVMERFGVPATARASLALYNTRDDVDALVAGLRRAREVFA